MLGNDGDSLSRGQRQLISIARAQLAGRSILVLDEATSSVDSRTEVQIRQAMQRLRQGRTSFVIAHRLSTVRDADLILVMDHGRIVEQGTHQQLMAKGGLYMKLYEAQFAGREQAQRDQGARTVSPAETSATAAAPFPGSWRPNPGSTVPLFEQLRLQHH